MSVACFFRAGQARKDGDERRLAPHQEIQRGMNGAEILELVEPVGTSAQLAGSLRTAQQENAEKRDFVAMKIEDLLKAMLVFGDTAIRGGRTREAMIVERVEGVANGVVIEIHERVAI
jgi:hypothetical protein